MPNSMSINVKSSFLLRFAGENVMTFPSSEMKKITSNFPDVDQLDGYPDLDCDPPRDHYAALAKYEKNKNRIIHWVRILDVCVCVCV